MNIYLLLLFHRILIFGHSVVVDLISIKMCVRASFVNAKVLTFIYVNTEHRYWIFEWKTLKMNRQLTLWFESQQYTWQISKIHWSRYVWGKKRDGVVLPLLKGSLRNTAGYSFARQSISVYFTVCPFIIANQYIGNFDPFWALP